VADAQTELGRYDEAERTLQTMVDQRPDPSAYTRISYLRELHGDVAGALQMMQWAVDGSQPTGENGAWTRTQLANLHFNRGDLQQAELEYRRILDGWPHYAYALAGLGQVRAAQGRSDEAIQLLTQACQIVPLPEFVIALGDLYRVKGDSAAAAQQYALVRAIQQLFRANGVDIDMEMALFDADHVVDRAGNHRSDPAAVVAQARQAFAARPSIHAADALAWALYRAGAYREAQEYAAQALMLGTKDALKLYHAGMIAYRLDRPAEARAYLERALAINPYFSILSAAAASRTLHELR
jgi:tetratricopeptide (TPR) repeat protein